MTPLATLSALLFLGGAPGETLPGVASPDSDASQIAIHLDGSPGKRLVATVTGLAPEVFAAIARDTSDPAHWPFVFSVHALRTKTESTRDIPPLLGSYRVEVNSLTFTSRFPVDSGTSYKAVLTLKNLPGFANTPSKSATFDARQTNATSPPVPTSVVRVSPSQNVLPENLLKFYIEFSAPMSRGEAYENVQLLNAAGKPLDLPFLELGEELWDPRGMRFTLLFDPGRIKTGLRPREELGPVLEAGKSYTLVIKRAWQNATGHPLKSEYRKPFRVNAPDVVPPDPANWKLTLPAAGTRESLRSNFPEPLDRAMLGRVLGVAAKNGKAIVGTTFVGEDETTWSFTPENPWAAGSYELLIDRTLEDQAGNSIRRPFEVDVFKKIDQGETPEVIRLPFVVNPRPL